MGRSMKLVLAGVILLVCSVIPRAQSGPQATAGKTAQKGCPGATRYYILTKAMLATEETVSIFGASNLPAGSLLTIYVSDYMGEGSTLINDEVTVDVGKDGLFWVEIHPKAGLRFRTNMVCQVSFWPNDRSQPPDVLKIVGAAGEHLGTSGTNPQIYGYPKVTILMDDTFVKQ